MSSKVKVVDWSQGTLREGECIFSQVPRAGDTFCWEPDTYTVNIQRVIWVGDGTETSPGEIRIEVS